MSKLVTANKLTPDAITNYTKVIFKERLEIINGFAGTKDIAKEVNLLEYRKIEKTYVELIKMASQYYDMVLVDVDKMISPDVRNEILEASNLNVIVISQKKECLNRYIELKKKNKEVNSQKTLPVIGKYNNESKYNTKNVMKYIGEKKELNVVPFNTLYFESAEESTVPDLFLRLKSVKDTSDANYIFMQDVLKLMDKIIDKLQELQMKMG